MRSRIKMAGYYIFVPLEETRYQTNNALAGQRQLIAQAIDG